MLATLMLLFAVLTGSPSSIEERATVLLFVRTDCPISNRYAPELQRLYRQFSPQGIGFRLVYTERGLTPAAMESHRTEYGYTIPAVLDPGHEFAGRARARVTPHAAVFVGGQPVYVGRIEDRYPDTGKSRPGAVRRDLEEVLAAVAAGKIPPFRETKGVGCAIENPQ